MNRLCFFVITGLIFATCVNANVLVGEVDIQEVLISVKEGKKVRNKLKKVFDKKQKELKKGESQVRKMQEDFKKQHLVMNEKAKMKKEREIQEKIFGLQKLTMEYQKEIQEMERKLKRPLLERVRKIVDLISKKEGVDITVEVSSAPIIYAKKTKSLTKQVIKAYDKEYK